MSWRRVTGLTTYDFSVLNDACGVLRGCFGERVYLVGSALGGGPFRDVDVRVILDDATFDQIFGVGPNRLLMLWSVVCQGIGAHLRHTTGLPIDFQIQRKTQADEKFLGQPRNRLGWPERPYAGNGDATYFDDGPQDPTTTTKEES